MTVSQAPTLPNNILRKIAQDNFEHTFYIKYIKNCIISASIKFKEFIEIIDQKSVIVNGQNKVNDNEQKYYIKRSLALGRTSGSLT